MLKNIVKSLILIASVFPMLSFAVENNDFTGRNESFNERVNLQSSSLTSQRANLKNNTAIEQKSFSMPEARTNFGDKKSWLESNDSAKSLFNGNASGFSETFKSKRFKGMSGAWTASKEATIKNADNNLSKDYKGKIDTFKRDTDKQKMIDKYYDTINDRSFDEINRYYSKNSRSEGEREFVRKAGGNIQDDDSSFFDIFSSKEHIGREPVVWRKVNRETLKQMQDNANDGAPPISTDGVLGVYQKGKFTLPQSAGQSAESAIHSAVEQLPQATIAERIRQVENKRRGYEETEIDPEVAKRTNFLKLPDNMRSKATIKVEIKDSGF